MSTRDIGNMGEQAVCDMLLRHGYRILKRNYTIRGGEIDIIAEKNELLSFVEVKTRRHDPLTTGEQAITYAKRRHIIKAAEKFMLTLDEPMNARFDVAVVEHDKGKITKIRYYVSAFDASK